MTTEDLPKEDDKPGERQQAEALYERASRKIDQLEDSSSPDTQLMVLQAIYHELRHGHDQVACQTAALNEHTAAMDQLRSALAEHSDALHRHSRAR